jgi:succinyl-diaminopimelate desuccinylase
VQHVIIPEPLNKDRICLGHRGVWWAEIETKGRIAHGSMPFLGDCAVRHMGAVLAEMEASSSRCSPQAHRDARGARRRASSTLNINAIHGGEPEQEPGFTGLPAPCVPDRCRITIDRRFLIEEDIAAVKGEMRALLDRSARPARFRLRDARPVRGAPDHDRPRRAGGPRRLGGDRAVLGRRRTSSSRPAPTTRSISTGSAG